MRGRYFGKLPVVAPSSVSFADTFPPRGRLCKALSHRPHRPPRGKAGQYCAPPQPTIPFIKPPPFSGRFMKRPYKESIPVSPFPIPPRSGHLFSSLFPLHFSLKKAPLSGCFSRYKTDQYASFSRRYSRSSLMGMRTCAMVSRSRTVTQPSPAFSSSPTVSKSTVMQ